MSKPAANGATASDKTKYRIRDLPQSRATGFALRPGKDKLSLLATDLDLMGLRKLSFEGDIRAAGKADWHLTGHLGVTVVQPCVVTLEPVTTRIEAEVTRHYLAEMPELGDDEEVEMPEDENAEKLGEEIDLEAVLYEALALNLPQFPRAEGAEMTNTVFTEPGKKAMTDEDARPFAGLAALKNKLGGGEAD